MQENVSLLTFLEGIPYANPKKVVMPVVSSLLGLFGATLGLYVTQRFLTLPEPPNFVDPANYFRDLVLSDDEMCGLTTGGMEECWWGCKFKRKILPQMATYDVSRGWTNFSKTSQIEPLFLCSMWIGEIRSHTKFQVSSLNILEWQPHFVNQPLDWESHLKWPESGTFDLAPFICIKNALHNGITLGVLAFRKYLKRLEENW